MTFRRVDSIKCDGCELEVPLKEAVGWYAVSNIIVSQEQYEAIAIRAEYTGSDGLVRGDFCSLPCMYRWAENAETLRQMEGQ